MENIYKIKNQLGIPYYLMIHPQT